MRITFFPMVAMFVTTALHIPFCFIFVNGFDLGIVGLGVASSTKDFILVASTMLYGKYVRNDVKVVL